MADRKHQVVIYHLGEPCVFAIERIELSVADGYLDLDVFTNPNEDCPLGHLCAPELHIESATVHAASTGELTVEEFEVEVGWDIDEVRKEDNIFRIYISQHVALNNNRVRIVRTASDRIEIAWRSVAQDFIDFRNPESRVEVFCEIVGV